MIHGVIALTGTEGALLMCLDGRYRSLRRHREFLDVAGHLSCGRLMLALHDLYISWVSSFRFLDKLSSTCGWKGGYDCDDDDCNLGNTRAAKTRSGLNSVVS